MPMPGSTSSAATKPTVCHTSPRSALLQISGVLLKTQKAREGKGTLSRSRLLQPGVSQASVEATWSKRSEWKLQVAQNIQPSED